MIFKGLTFTYIIFPSSPRPFTSQTKLPAGQIMTRLRMIQPCTWFKSFFLRSCRESIMRKRGLYQRDWTATNEPCVSVCVCYLTCRDENEPTVRFILLNIKSRLVLLIKLVYIRLLIVSFFCFPVAPSSAPLHPACSTLHAPPCTLHPAHLSKQVRPNMFFVFSRWMHPHVDGPLQSLSHIY